MQDLSTFDDVEMMASGYTSLIESIEFPFPAMVPPTGFCQRDYGSHRKPENSLPPALAMRRIPFMARPWFDLTRPARIG